MTGPALLALLLGAAAPSPATPAAAADEERASCSELAGRISELTGGAMASASQMQDLAAANAPEGQLVAQAKNQLLGSLLNALPGKAAGAAATVVGMAEKAANRDREAKRDASEQRLQEIEAAQGDALDRLLRLHELHEAKCAAGPQ